MALRGFKTKIAFNIALLLLLSAIITDVLAFLFAQNYMIRREILQRRNVLESIAQTFFVQPVTDRASFDSRMQVSLSPMLEKAGFESVFITSISQEFYFRNNSPDLRNRLKKAAETAYHSQTYIQHNLSEERTLFTRKPHELLIAFSTGTLERGGAVSAAISLGPIHQAIREFNRPVLLYIVLNTLVLTVIGFYRIFRIYLRPIDRIIRQAGKYREDEDLFFAFRREDNELNRLSSALNRMLKRITSDRQALKDTVASLEEANFELKQAQSDVIKAEKLASVGRLAAGIAHEIGNPIGIVIGYLELLGKKNLSEEQKQDFLLRADTEMQRINRIIRQLLDLAHPKESQDEIVDVHWLIAEMVEVMRIQPIMKGIDIDCEALAEAHHVQGRVDQLRQVLLNLMINSADAIRNAPDQRTGCIRISTSCETGPAGHPPQWILVRCSDTGTGIPCECIEYVFDPFYTSKAPGKGTGLGLAVSFMIVQKMGGSIKACNNPEGGSSMTLRLPLIRHAEADRINTVGKQSAGIRENA